MGEASGFPWVAGMIHPSIAIPYGEEPAHRISAYNEAKLAQLDAERMELLNSQIAREPRPRKYLYVRKHTKTAPGERCSICGRKYGPCTQIGQLDAT